MTHSMNEAIRSGLDTLAESVAEAKPKLRGWLHLATAPLTLAGGIVLIVLSPDETTRIGSAVVTAGLGVPAPLRPRQHLPADRGLLHPVQPAAPARHPADRAAVRGVDRRGARGALPGLLDRCAPLALRADLPRARLG